MCNNYLEGREGGGEAGKWVKYAPKTKSCPLLIKQKLISTPPHIMIILRLPHPLTPHPLP